MLRELVRSIAGSFGIALIRTETHRGVSLFADLRRLLDSSDGVIFDVGANVGAFTKAAAAAFPRHAIYSCEPVSTTVVALRENVAHLRNVRVIEAACGDHSGVAAMAIAEQSAWNRIADVSTASTVSVSMLTVDAICERERVQRINFLKTDCEGYDLNVLRGAEGMFADRAVDTVYCEVDFHRNGGHGDFFAIDEYLRRFGFTFYALYEYSAPGYSMSETFANALWIARPRA